MGLADGAAGGGGRGPGRRRSRNPFVPAGADRLLACDGRTGRVTVDTTVAGGVEAVRPYAAGRVLLDEAGADGTLLLG